MSETPVIPFPLNRCPHPMCPIAAEPKLAELFARMGAAEDREETVREMLVELAKARAEVNSARLDGIEARVDAGEKREVALAERLDRLMLLMLGTLFTAVAGLGVQVAMFVLRR